MAKGKREQTQNAESVVNTRQDRNTFVTDGGTWTWDIGTGTLTWSSNFNIRRGGVTIHQVAGPGSVVGMTSNGNIAFIDVDRVAGGFVTVEGGSAPGPLININDSTNSSDERLVLGVVGSDGKFYMRDGTIFSDGDSKPLGTLNSVTDRADIAASGGTTDTVPFTYNVGSNQLAVYVGGALMEAGLHYTETDPTTITWTAYGQPAAGERVSFVNIIGGQGPPGATGSLQTAYDQSRIIETAGTLGAQVHLWNSNAPLGGYFWPVLVGWGADDTTAQGWADANGGLWANSGSAGLSIVDNINTDYWKMVPLDDGGKDLVLYYTENGAGIRFDSAGGIEHGAYTPGLTNYPGGTWTPAGSGGGLRWAIFTGTIDAGGADEVIATGLTNLIGLALSVDDGNRGGTNALDQANQQFANKRISAFFDRVTGVVTFSGNLAQSQLIGSHLWGETYTLIVYYQG